ncbi:hypothetical protein B6U66_04065 [Candidatus Bathyarchaeota archaeon ex4484_135]|nr:MAG: hypothetical protein B6U66_04065 [Candidatus Bathyarchaeota archaeon ex4484_135]
MRAYYKVVRCPKCGWLQVTSAEKATRCKRCGSTISLEASKPLAVAATAFEAREKLLALKAKLKKSGGSSMGDEGDMASLWEG